MCSLACGRLSHPSEVKITNGKPTNGFPAVVKLNISWGGRETYCSGAFLSDSALLTAARCFFNASSDEVKVGQTPAISYHRHPKFQYHIPAIPDLDATDLDIALVKFPKGTSQHFLMITEKGAEPGAQVVVVGYGSPSILAEKKSPSSVKVGHS
jgi:Trypsin